MGLSVLRCGGALLATVTAVALAGCGSGGSGGSSSAPAASGTATATSSASSSAPATTSTPGSSSTSASSTSSSSSAATETAAIARTPGCGSAHTAVSLGQGNAGLGHVGEVLLFRNSGSTTCTLAGYPGAALVAASGRHKLLNIARTPQGYLGGLSPQDKSDPVVRLAPGESGSALLEGEDASSSGGTCPRYQALLVTPPNQTVTIRLTQAFQICDPEIHPVVTGTRGTESQ